MTLPTNWVDSIGMTVDAAYLNQLDALVNGLVWSASPKFLSHTIFQPFTSATNVKTATSTVDVDIPLGSKIVVIDVTGLNYLSSGSPTLSWSAAIGADNFTVAASASFFASGGYTAQQAKLYLLNPPTGTQSISLTFTTTVSNSTSTISIVSGYASFYSGVSSVGTAATSTSSNTQTATPSLTVSSAAGQLVQAAIAAEASGGPNMSIINFTNTLRANDFNNVSFPLLAGETLGRPSVIISATNSQNAYWSCIGLPLVA